MVFKQLDQSYMSSACDSTITLTPFKLIKKMKRQSSLNSQKSSVSAKQSARQSQSGAAAGDNNTIVNAKYAIFLKLSSKYETEKKEMMLKNKETIIYSQTTFTSNQKSK